MTDHLESASKAADRGGSYDLALAQAHASVAMASALENIGTAISCLEPGKPRVTLDERDALALRMAEWWQNSPVMHTGARLEYVLDCLLDELGVDVSRRSVAKDASASTAEREALYAGPWPDLGKVPVVVEVVDRMGYQWKHIKSGWHYWNDRGRWVDAQDDYAMRSNGPFVRATSPVS